jgi:hypothetical protein
VSDLLTAMIREEPLSTVHSVFVKTSITYLARARLEVVMYTSISDIDRA